MLSSATAQAEQAESDCNMPIDRCLLRMSDAPVTVAKVNIDEKRLTKDQLQLYLGETKLKEDAR